jgi:hypothetical protein
MFAGKVDKDLGFALAMYPLIVMLPLLLALISRMNGAIMRLQEEVESLTEQLGSSDSSES